jgi:hypothetical protein
VVGQEYLVFGLSFLVGSLYGTTTVVDYYDGSGIVSAPIALFEVTNPHISRYWEAKKLDNGEMHLWPPQFYAEYFHDRLSDGEQEATEAFERVYMLLENEDKASGKQTALRRDPVNEILADIQTAILTSRTDLVAKHIDPDSTVVVLSEGSVDYTLSGREYLDIAGQIMEPSQVAELVWRKAEWKPDGSVTWFGMLRFRDESRHAAYVSYTLRHVEANYLISEVGSSSKPTW